MIHRGMELQKKHSANENYGNARPKGMRRPRPLLLQLLLRGRQTAQASEEDQHAPQVYRADRPQRGPHGAECLHRREPRHVDAHPPIRPRHGPKQKRLLMFYLALNLRPQFLYEAQSLINNR